MEPNNLSSRRAPGLVIIAFWLLLLPSQGVYRNWHLGWGAILSPQVTLDWLYYGCGIAAAVGLLLLKPWARIVAVSVIMLQFVWFCWVVYSLAGSAFPKIIEYYSGILQVSPTALRICCVSMIVIYLLWLFGVLFYLSNPKTKLSFHPQIPKYI